MAIAIARATYLQFDYKCQIMNDVISPNLCSGNSVVPFILVAFTFILIYFGQFI